MAKIDPAPDPASGGRPSTEEVEAPDDQLEASAAPETTAAALVPPEVVANTLGEYLNAQARRIRGGESGVLPVLLGLIVIVIVFQLTSPNGVFLTAGNIVNLFQQSAVFMVLSMAEIFVLLLGEIDLSLGYLLAVGGTVAVQLVQPTTTDWPWWAAIAAALIVCAFIGGVWGTLITRLRLPSFIVTLGGLLILNGVLLWLLALGPFSGISEPQWQVVEPAHHPQPDVGPAGPPRRLDRHGGRGRSAEPKPLAARLTPARSGLVAPPVALTYIKIVFLAAIGIGVVAICNVNRASIGTLRGVPWAILIVLGVLGVWTLLLQRTRYGRYVYAIGGNAEAARRAGINVSNVRTLAFVLAGSRPESPACCMPPTWAACPTTSTAANSFCTPSPEQSSVGPRCSAAGARSPMACSVGWSSARSTTAWACSGYRCSGSSSSPAVY